MKKKSISSRDYYISIEQARAYASLGKLKIGIDRLTGQHLTNNPNILQLADNPKLLKSTWRAHNFWTYVMLGYFIVSIYLSFTSAWWFFLTGFISMAIFNPILIKSNEENLLGVNFRPSFYDVGADVFAFHLVDLFLKFWLWLFSVHYSNKKVVTYKGF